MSVDKQGGFTLVELLIVVVVLAIIAAVTVPLFMGYKNRKAKSPPKTISQQYTECLDTCEERFSAEGPLTACIEGCGKVYE